MSNSSTFPSSISLLFKIIDNYLHTLRVGRLISFSYVIFGAFLVSGLEGVKAGLPDLLYTIIYAGFLLYGGIYAFNRYIDYEEDRATQFKKEREQRYSYFSRSTFLIIALLHIVTGLLLISISYPQLLVPALLLLLVNSSYSLFTKKFNRFLSSLQVALTGPLKVVLGIILVGGSVGDFLPFLILHFLLSVPYHLEKQIGKGYLDKGVYSKVQLFLLFVAVLFVLLINAARVDWVLVVVVIFGVLQFLSTKTSVVRRFHMR